MERRKNNDDEGLNTNDASLGIDDKANELILNNKPVNISNQEQQENKDKNNSNLKEIDEQEIDNNITEQLATNSESNKVRGSTKKTTSKRRNNDNGNVIHDMSKNYNTRMETRSMRRKRLNQINNEDKSLVSKINEKHHQ